MRKNLLILCVLIFITMFSANAFGQKARRIAFARGATKAVISGRLSSYKSEVNFVMRLRAGQTLSISGSGGNHYVTLGISDPNGDDPMDYAADCHSHADISPTVAGDYKISVVECQKADPWRGTFKLILKAK